MDDVIETNEILADEIREYLALTDAQLPGYGLNRRMLESELADLEFDAH